MADDGMRQAQLKRWLMERAASNRNVDYDEAMLAPGRSDPERAYLLFSCGVDLLLGLTDPGYFPTLDARARRRGTKKVEKEFDLDGGEAAASFLAQGLGTLLNRINPNDAEAQTKLLGLLQHEYPISDPDMQVLERCQAEFVVMEQHKLRSDFALGAETGTGYHLALSRGENPDADEELVQAQRSYAMDFCALESERHALKLILGSDYRKVESKLLRPGQHDYEALAYTRLRLRNWTDTAAFWKNYASKDPKPFGEVMRRLRAADAPSAR